MLTDEVWAQLDHGAARLPRKQLRRVHLALVALLVAAQLGAVAWASGVIVPRLTVDRHHSQAHLVYHSGYTLVVGLRNDGWLPVTVTDWGATRSGPGRYLRPSGAPGFTLRPGETRDISIGYQIADCAAPGDAPRLLPVRVDRPWGTLTVHAAIPHEHADWIRETCDPNRHR